MEFTKHNDVRIQVITVTISTLMLRSKSNNCLCNIHYVNRWIHAIMLCLVTEMRTVNIKCYPESAKKWRRKFGEKPYLISKLHLTAVIQYHAYAKSQSLKIFNCKDLWEWPGLRIYAIWYAAFKWLQGPSMLYFPRDVYVIELFLKSTSGT